MILRYTHTDGTPHVWDLSTVRFLASEAEAVERTTDLEWALVMSRNALVVREAPTPRRAITWVLMKRETPSLRYSAFDPALDDISVKLGADDLVELRAEAEGELAKGQVTEAEFDQGMAQLDDLTDPEVRASEAAPKADQPVGGVNGVAQAPAEGWATSPSPLSV
ncbi:hypothetical protein ABZ312_11380 [Streptomyces sp. NPDC006207]